MSKRDELIAVYAKDLREKCDLEPDMDLLTTLVIKMEPVIYNADASLVAASDDSEMDKLRQNFLIKRLGLEDGPALDEGIDWAIDEYGRYERRKHRAVVYYLLVTHFKKESVYLDA